MNVFFDMVGCRLNQAEIEQMAAQFRAAGHTLLESAEGADLVVVNSCAVTAAAASDSRQKVRQARKAGAKEVIFTGCLATMLPPDLLLEGVTRNVPNDEKMDIPRLALDSPFIFDRELLARQPLPGNRKRTRAFIKVQDGCDNHCTFCITRIARGSSVSIGKETILQEVQAAEAGGTHEVVLSGVNLGAWGRDLDSDERLHDLVSYLLKNSQIERLRFSSLEPWDINSELLNLWQDCRVCRHLHLPLQSGSAGVLKRMARRTTPDEYLRLVEQARQAIPDLGLTTDIIVGFPGETDEEFEESLEFVRGIGFTGGHVFRFSPREGTLAEKMRRRVNGKISAQRSRMMRAVLEKSARQFSSGYIGSEMPVLWETAEKMGAGQWRLHGLTGNYLQLSMISPVEKHNVVELVKLEREMLGRSSIT